ncbi:hypothetical protein Syun_006864 [Stephania yunnanensis]|uniref:Cytidyltransferase-like domain-containing protein n=1 Tax=Stephania yunnanensis TaxID=152371 RepID=A0AAP0PY21_9MAGN
MPHSYIELYEPLGHFRSVAEPIGRIQPSISTAPGSYFFLANCKGIDADEHVVSSELARDALESEGYHFIGGYMSPVNGAYGKKGLIPANHRIQMCNLACRSSSFIMVDPWECHLNFLEHRGQLTLIHRARDRAKRRSTTTSEPVEHCCFHGIICQSNDFINYKSCAMSLLIVNTYALHIPLVYSQGNLARIDHFAILYGFAERNWAKIRHREFAERKSE